MKGEAVTGVLANLRPWLADLTGAGAEVTCHLLAEVDLLFSELPVPTSSLFACSP